MSPAVIGARCTVCKGTFTKYRNCLCGANVQPATMRRSANLRTLTLPTALYQRLRAVALARGVSTSALLEALLS